MLIGICGKAGAGKDTIGDHLIKEYGFEKIAFADPIKRLVKDVLVLDDHTVYDRVAREQPLEQWGGRSVRECLQFIGTDLFREQFDNDIWVKSLWFRIQNSEKNYVITDLRFPNEIDSLAQYGGKDFTSIKVHRKGCDGHVGNTLPPFKRFLYKLIRKDTRHASEKFDLQAEYDVDNNDSYESLYSKIDNLMAELKILKAETNNIETSMKSDIVYSEVDCSESSK
jgi:hypothetical protein